MSASESDRVPLRIQFSEAVSTETLEILHAEGLEGDLPAELRELFRAVGALRISSVHRLSPAQIQNDRYGFARDFKLSIKAEHLPDAAIDSLKKSVLVKSVKPILLRRS